MTALPATLAARARGDRQVLGPAAFLALAAAAGALAPSQARYAVALVACVCLVLLVAVRVSFLLILLTFTMFVESLSLSGSFTVDRLAGGFAAAVLLYLFVADRRLLRLRPSALLVLVGCYGVWLVLSSYWASDSGAVFSDFVSYGLTLFYMLAFALLMRSRETLRLIFKTLAFGALVFGIVALVTYVASHGTSRAAGLQGDPNYFAQYQVLALPAVLMLASSERRPGWRRLYYLTIGVILLSVVSSQSRGGLVALVVILLITLAMSWRTFFRSPRQKRGYVAMILAMAGLSLLVGSGGFAQRAGTLFSGGDGGSGRTDIWSAAWRVWKMHPWLGIGGNNFRANSLTYLQTTPGVNTAAHYVVAGKEVHNGYLETLTELGVVGLVLFLLIIGLTAWYFHRAFRDATAARDLEMRRMAAALLLGLIAVLITSFFLSYELGRALWIFVGLALALDTTRRVKTGPSRARRPLNGAVGGRRVAGAGVAARGHY